MNNMIIYWFICKPFRYIAYRIRLKQGLSKNYSYEFVSERTHQEIMAFLLITNIEEERKLWIKI